MCGLKNLKTVALWLGVVMVMNLTGGCQHLCLVPRLNVPPQSPPPSAEVGSSDLDRLKVLTWNIWMMPSYTFQSPKNKRRSAVMAEELLKQDFDILCLEKVFSSGARQVLSKALAARYPYQYGPANHTGFSLKINSGVWIASRWPLSDYHQIQFRDSAGIEWFSRKGAMLLTGNFHGRRFQILATHLQGEEGANYTEAHQKVRDLQLKQMRDELVVRYEDSNTPLLLCGDFDTPRMDPKDTSRESAAYQGMLETLGTPQNHADYMITLDDACSDNDLATDNSGRTDELDYILVKAGKARVKPEWHRVILLRPGWDGCTTRKNLSYRYGMSVSIEFQ